MPDLSIRAGDRNPVLLATLRNDDASPVNLTNATSAALSMRRRDSTSLAIDNAAATFVTPRTSGQVSYAWVAGDTEVSDIGSYWAEVHVVWNDGTTQTFPAPDFLSIEITPNLASLPVISDEDLAVIRSYVGADPSDLALALLLARLGTPEKVAAEILSGRVAQMPYDKIALDGDVTLDVGKGAERMQRTINQLRSPDGSGLATGLLYRDDRER